MLGRIFNYFRTDVCRHDWEVLEYTNSEYIDHDILYSDSNIRMPYQPHYGRSKPLKKQVCLKCGTVDDQIAKYKEELVTEAEKKRCRQELARSIMESRE